MVHGPAEGLRLLEALDAGLPGSHRLDAVRGHLHELAGDARTAVVHYRAAAARTASTPGAPLPDHARRQAQPPGNVVAPRMTL